MNQRRSASPRRTLKPGNESNLNFSHGCTQGGELKEDDPPKQLFDRSNSDRRRTRRFHSHDVVKTGLSNSPRRSHPYRSQSSDSIVVNVRPKLCRDQAQSIRNLLVDDDMDAVIDSEDKQRSQKKKALELKCEMEKRAMLNKQFKSIKNVINEFQSEKIKDIDKRKKLQTKVKKSLPVTLECDDTDDQTFNFDPFTLNMSQVEITREKDNQVTKSRQDVTFHKDSTKALKSSQKRLGDRLRNISISTLEDDPTAEEEWNDEEDNFLDFETVIWGPNHSSSSKDLVLGGRNIQLANFSSSEINSIGNIECLVPIDQTNEGRLSPRKIKSRLEKEAKLSISSPLKNSVHSGSSSKQSRITDKSFRRESIDSVNSDKVNGSVNTNNSDRSATEAPSKKKKKKTETRNNLVVREKTENKQESPFFKSKKTPLIDAAVDDNDMLMLRARFPKSPSKKTNVSGRVITETTENMSPKKRISGPISPSLLHDLLVDSPLLKNTRLANSDLMKSLHSDNLLNSPRKSRLTPEVLLLSNRDVVQKKATAMDRLEGVMRVKEAMTKSKAKRASHSFHCTRNSDQFDDDSSFSESSIHEFLDF